MVVIKWMVVIYWLLKSVPVCVILQCAVAPPVCGMWHCSQICS